jgi:hypothetical protein
MTCSMNKALNLRFHTSRRSLDQFNGYQLFEGNPVVTCKKTANLNTEKKMYPRDGPVCCKNGRWGNCNWLVIIYNGGL